jgi:Cytochrome P460
MQDSALPDHQAWRDTTAMRKTNSIFILAACILIIVSATAFRYTAPAAGPEYTADNQLKLPENYREWVYLTSGFDMSYSPDAMGMGHHMFDNVFVNPEAYHAFLKTGTWPDKTMMILEGRRAEGKGSINQNGNYQSSEVHGLEVHVKDEARFQGKWAFFMFHNANDKTATMIPLKENCYSCHTEHGAVDTTFVQFYPTLMPIAKAKGTLAASYLKETAKETEPATKK